jgi:hypothetical protein
MLVRQSQHVLVIRHNVNEMNLSQVKLKLYTVYRGENKYNTEMVMYNDNTARSVVKSPTMNLRSKC